MLNPQGKDVFNCNMNTYNIQSFKLFSISYKDNQPTELNSWNREAWPLSIFGNIKFLDIDSKNISTLLLHMADFIHKRKLVSNTEKDILSLFDFDQAI